MTNSLRTIGFLDFPDPDNFAAAAAMCWLNETDVPMVMTQRPLFLKATKNTELFEDVEKDSEKALIVGAARIRNFVRYWGYNSVRVFHGGIAPITPIPHHIHFPDYYQFREKGYDPIAASEYPELEPLGLLIKEILDRKEKLCIVVGGPLTGLRKFLEKGFRRNTEGKYECVADYIQEVHIMGPSCPDLIDEALNTTNGVDRVMDFMPGRTQKQQFNIMCDPLSFYYVYNALPDAEFYFTPTQVTKVQALGFRTPKALEGSLPETEKAESFCFLYDNHFGGGWYPQALKPRDEWIYIHDLAPVISSSKLRYEMYDWLHCNLDHIYMLPQEIEKYGQVDMSISQEETRCHLAIKPKSQRQYMDFLYEMFS